MLFQKIGAALQTLPRGLDWLLPSRASLEPGQAEDESNPERAVTLQGSGLLKRCPLACISLGGPTGTWAQKSAPAIPASGP